MAANVLAVASTVGASLFGGKPSSLSAYNIHTSPNPSPASSSTHLPSTSSSSFNSKPLHVGLWRVARATHKTTNKDVSVWTFEKRVLDTIKGDASGRPAHAAREWVVEQLKKEAMGLSRLRHPDILHMVEPLEETRSELTFVTETVTASLGTLLHSSTSASTGAGGSRRPPGPDGAELDLDEVEIQKGTLQIAKGLAFLHTQARMVHLNLSPEAILVNAKGDWKLSGLGLITPLSQPDGTPTKYVYPEVDNRLPPQVQWKLDYLAPEYALDSTMTPAADLYSLGCVLFAVHMGGRPPFQNRGSMQSLREHAEGSLVKRDWASGPKWERCSSEVKDLLPRLLTRQPSTRISLGSLPSHPFFSSLAINTLNFLDPTTFASKPREEKATFLRGLVRVLPSFSDRLRRGKLLPSLLEEMKDPYLLPFILPNVFEISKSLTKDDFTTVLPKLQPLFALRDPPQNMMTLLEHLSLFEEKTTPQQFRENVMPLIYNSLECEHLPVQEKALKTVPHLCEILDYGTVQNILLVKVAILFTRTRILSVKVQTLQCFQSMVKTLDKATLTTKLVPLLAKIKTKEPAVMMATLGVHEAMGAKVDREAIATLVLPQLWAMSMGPLLNADQFGRFMTVIKSLGSRVEAEHTQHLRDLGRIEQQTATYSPDINGMARTSSGGVNGDIDFESLVKGRGGTPNPFATVSATPNPADPWSDDGWLKETTDSGLSDAFASALQPSTTGTSFPSMTPATTSPAPASPRVASGTSTARTSRLNARPVPSSVFNSSVFDSAPETSSTPTLTFSPPSQSTSTLQPLRPLQPTGSTFTPGAPLQPLQPTQRALPPSQTSQTNGSRPLASGSGPNYSLSLSPQAPAASMSPPNTFARPPIQSTLSSSSSSFTMPPPQPVQSPQPQPPQPPRTQQPLQPAMQPPPGWSAGLMQPTKAAKPAAADLSKIDWGDFDPLK